MIVGVIGYGVVGTATCEVLKRLGHTVLVKDTDPVRIERAYSRGCGALNQDVEPESVFICVPEGNVREALASAPCSPITVLRSTVPPGTTERLSAETGRPLVFLPETLREATPIWDAMSPPFMLIGCQDKELGGIVAEIFAPLMVPYALVPSTIAEMVKLALNAHFHTLISFWNEIHLICELIGVPSHVVGVLCSLDPRVSTYGARMHGDPAGGTCLPKDLRQLIAFAEDKGYAPMLLKSVQRINEIVRWEGEEARNGHRSPTELRDLQAAGLIPTRDSEIGLA